MPRKIRPIRVEGNVAYITLTKGYEAVIDAADVPLVDAWNWHVMIKPRTAYAMRKTTAGKVHETIFMHHVILGCGKGKYPDHIDCDGLNNRRSNLRVATAAQNARNKRPSIKARSGYRGVCWRAGSKKWAAYIGSQGKRRFLGSFEKLEDAAAAYAAAAVEAYGEFARPHNS